MLGCKPFTDTELDALLASIDSPRDRLMVILGVKTGFRISELLSIKIQDILENGQLKSSITVARSKMKGKYSSRSVPISESLTHALQSYLKEVPENQEYLFQSRKFQGKLTRVQGYRIIHNAAQKAGLTGKIGSHSLRKTLAKKIYEASGKDLVMTQKALGHKNINSTISYLQIGQEQVDNLFKGI